MSCSGPGKNNGKSKTLEVNHSNQISIHLGGGGCMIIIHHITYQNPQFLDNTGGWAIQCISWVSLINILGGTIHNLGAIFIMVIRAHYSLPLPCSLPRMARPSGLGATPCPWPFSPPLVLPSVLSWLALGRPNGGIGELSLSQTPS